MTTGCNYVFSYVISYFDKMRIKFLLSLNNCFRVCESFFLFRSYHGVIVLIFTYQSVDLVSILVDTSFGLSLLVVHALSLSLFVCLFMFSGFSGSRSSTNPEFQI